MAIIQIRRVEVIREALDDFKNKHPEIYSADSRAIEYIVNHYVEMETELAAARKRIQNLTQRLDHYNHDKARLSAALQPFLVAVDPGSPICKNCSDWNFEYIQRGVAVGRCGNPDNDEQETNEIFSCDFHEAV